MFWEKKTKISVYFKFTKFEGGRHLKRVKKI